MNEFIVWSEVHKKFFDVDSVHFDEKIPNQIDFKEDGKTTFEAFALQYGYIKIEGCKLFSYIGKTDINNKNIYANSSVVECFINNEYWRKCKIIFSVNRMAYVLKDINSNDVFTFYSNTIEFLKIVGTLQENPELMEK